jgi:hypothetical protein
MDVAIDLAVPADDPGIRSLVRRQVTPGRIRLALPREPDFALGCAVTGDDCRILVARSGEDGEVVGVACRSTRPVFINGREERIGYLSQLRVDERFRGRWLVSRGFARLAQMNREDPLPMYLASIVDGNDAATGVLVRRRRPNSPVFREVARYRTLALPTRRPKPVLPGDEEIVSGSQGNNDQLREVAQFLRTQGTRRQFFSVWTEEALRSLDSLGLRIEDVRIARKAGEIVGVIALWDQTAYKQAIVRGYTGWLKFVAPLAGVAGSWLPGATLPRVGAEVRSAYASLVCVANDDARLLDRLLRAVYNLAASRRFDYLLVGLDARDPLVRVVRRYPHVSYPSRLYLAAWPDGSGESGGLPGELPHEPLNGAPAYVDIATL